MKPPTSVPIIILCLVYAYHPIMVHHIKSPGGGWFWFWDVSCVSLQLLPQRSHGSHGSLSRTDGLPLLLIKLFLRGKVAGRNLVHGCLMMNVSRPLYNLTLMICSFTSINMGVSENSVPLNPMVLLIIIPIKWLFHWEYTIFSDKPKCSSHGRLSECFDDSLLGSNEELGAVLTLWVSHVLGFCCAVYPHICWLPGLVNIQKTIENGHWNSGFTD